MFHKTEMRDQKNSITREDKKKKEKRVSWWPTNNRINTIFPNEKEKRKKNVQLPKIWASPFPRSGAGIEASLSEALCARARIAPPGVFIAM